MARDKQSDHYLGALLEDIDSKLDGLIESVSILATSLINTRSELKSVKEDTILIRPMYKVLKLHTQQLNNHEDRITVLESHR